MSSKAYILAAVFLAISFLTAAAQTTITVSTDKKSYADGDTISISGTVADQFNAPVSIVIRNSSHGPVYVAQTNPNSDGTYSTQAIVGGSTWKAPGTYEIYATHVDPSNTATTTFEYTGNSVQQPNGANNQTNTTPPTVPEFGPLAVSVFAISIAVIIAYAKTRHAFKI